MGIGPVPAIGAMLEKTGVSLGEVDQIEINEAFAAQTISCQKALDIPIEKFNTCGGAIALGHPLAASGSRISAHVVHKIRREGKGVLKIFLQFDKVKGACVRVATKIFEDSSRTMPPQ